MDTSTKFSINIIRAPNPTLRIKTKPVKKITPALLQTLKQMIKLAKTFKDPEGVGLASTQIGLDECFFVVKNGQQFMAVINPKILSTGKRTRTYLEGCLSIPDYYGEVKRHSLIKVSCKDQVGQTITKTLKGIPAWIFQHEMDHLEGVLFPDKVLKQKGKFYKCIGKDKTGTDIFEEVMLQPQAKRHPKRLRRFV